MIQYITNITIICDFLEKILKILKMLPLSSRSSSNRLSVFIEIKKDKILRSMIYLVSDNTKEFVCELAGRFTSAVLSPDRSRIVASKENSNMLVIVNTDDLTKYEFAMSPKQNNLFVSIKELQFKSIHTIQFCLNEKSEEKEPLNFRRYVKSIKFCWHGPGVYQLYISKDNEPKKIKKIELDDPLRFIYNRAA